MCEVKSTFGNTHLGGLDFDKRILDYFLNEFKRKTGKDISKDKKAKRRLMIACERAKCLLTEYDKVDVELDSLADDPDTYLTITKKKFEELNADHFQSTLIIIKEALKRSKLSKNDINEVVLVGGSSKIPMIQSIVSEFFQGKQLITSLNVDEAIAYGAAVQAALLFNAKSFVGMKRLMVLDVSPLSAGADNAFVSMTTMSSKNTTAPNSVLPQASFDSVEKLGEATETAVKIQLVKGDENMDNWTLNLTTEEDSASPKRITITNKKGEVSRLKKVEDDLKSGTMEANEVKGMDPEDNLEHDIFNVMAFNEDATCEEPINESEVLLIIKTTRTVVLSVLEKTPDTKVEQKEKLTEILRVLGLIIKRLEHQSNEESTDLIEHPQPSEISENSSKISEHSQHSQISEHSQHSKNSEHHQQSDELSTKNDVEK